MKNTKQKILALSALLVLVISMVGVSFAFFNYTKDGGTNNIITTGSIYFDYQESKNNLMFTNKFPQTYTEAKQNNEVFSFDVSASLPKNAKPLYYEVKMIKGDVFENKMRMPDDEIRLYVSKTGSEATILNNYDQEGGNLVLDSEKGFIIASGKVMPGDNNYKTSFSILMWVDSDVTISDTSKQANYRASDDAEYLEKTLYQNLYYSLKIKVTSSSGIS